MKVRIKSVPNSARNASKWKHEEGGNLYEDGGGFLDFFKSGIQKARQKVKDWGLDKDPIEHLASRVITGVKDIRDNRDSELSNIMSAALNTGRILGINKAIKGGNNDAQYRQNLYNTIDPTNIIPESWADIMGYAGDIIRAKTDKKYPYRRKHIDASADAAWAKRLGLPYDKTLLIDNTDGSVRLSQQLENEIPTDTTFIKERIANNKKLRDKTYGKVRGDIEAALNIDEAALSALRHTYKTGEPVEMNEFSHNSRDLRNNSKTTPLNLLHRYTIQYDKNNNAMKYWDIYDFNGLEDYVPGNPFPIRGTINLNKKK